MEEKMSNMDFINVPDSYPRRELNALYREIPLKDTVFRLLRKYFCAMANLYCVIPVSKAWEIISEIHPNLVTKEEFVSFAKIAVHEDEGYVIIGSENYIRKKSTKTKVWDKEIVSEDLFDLGFDAYKYMKEHQQGKDYYIPSKDELLLYTEFAYCNNLPEKEELLKFLTKHYEGNRDKALDTLELAVYLDRVVMMMPNEIMKELSETCFQLTGVSDLEEFASAFTKFHNSLKMPYNRGYSPSELGNMFPRSSTPPQVTIGPNMLRLIESGERDPNELREQICETEFPDSRIRDSFLKELDKVAPVVKNAPQVGRNDPCPCGSGKKYKNCCGK